MQIVKSLKTVSGVGDAGAAVTVVPAGALAAGQIAHAIAVADTIEVDRRARVGLKSLSGSIRLLNDLLALPLDTRVHFGALSDQMVARLSTAPEGVVEIDGMTVRRLARPPVTVTAAVSAEQRWRDALTGALAFRPMCRSYVLVTDPQVDLSQHIWEAQIAGVGVLSLVDPDGCAVETLPAPPYVAPMKAARWRFAENVWAASLAGADRG